MRYRINHLTRYNYSEPASLSQNELFLNPRMTQRQQVLDFALRVDPEPQYLRQRSDYFGNTAQVFMVQHPHEELSISSTSVVETVPLQEPDPLTTPPWEEVARRLREAATDATREAYQFVFSSPMIEPHQAVTDYGNASFPPGRPLLDGALELMQRVFDDFTYDKEATDVDTSINQVLKKKRGVCQDFSHFMIGCLRGLGLAARYVSGYLETLPPPGQEKLIGVDASHAWLSLFLPDSGWVDLDPTNNLIPGEQHVTLAWGRDYGDVTPVKGVVMGGGQHSLLVTVDMTRLTDSPAPEPP